MKGAPDRAAVLRAIASADSALAGGLVAAIRVTATHGRTSADEVRENWPQCNNPGVYASTFNLGAVAAGIVGEAQALAVIDAAAAKGPGSAYSRVSKALAFIAAESKRVAGKRGAALKPAAAKLAVKAATVHATSAKVEKLAPAGKGAKRGTKSPDAATLASAAAESGRDHKAMASFLRLASNSATRMPEPVGRVAAHREALQALQLACEKWAVFLA